MVACILDPRAAVKAHLVQHLILGLELQAEVELGGDLHRGVPKHPPVGDACGAVGRHPQGGRTEVLVSRREGVRVRHRPGELERCHEGGVLGDTGREPRIRTELVHPLAGDRQLEGIVALLADAPEREACRVVERSGAEVPGPTRVVPGDTVGKMGHWQLWAGHPAS
jgi:hypothetical protein